MGPLVARVLCLLLATVHGTASSYVRRGHLQLPMEVECPSGMHSDASVSYLRVTHMCVPAVESDCVAGARWKERCNTCQCPADGTATRLAANCSTAACPGYYEPPLGRGNSKLCFSTSTDCEPGCTFVLRDWSCLYCHCGATPAAHQLEVHRSESCPAGYRPVAGGATKLCALAPAAAAWPPPAGRTWNSRSRWRPVGYETGLGAVDDEGWLSIADANRAQRRRVVVY